MADAVAGLEAQSHTIKSESFHADKRKRQKPCGPWRFPR